MFPIPIYQTKNTPNYNTNLCSVGTNKIIYLAIPYIVSANSEQTHHTPVSYLKVRMIKSGVVC